MKRIIAVLLSVVIVLSTSGCQSKPTNSEDDNGVCDCCEYYLEKVSEDKTIKKTDDTYILQCKGCSSPFPVEKLKFSIFLKYFYPKKDQDKLSQKKKSKALDPYIRTKTLMTRNEMNEPSSDIDIGQQKEIETPGVFEFVGMFAEKMVRFEEWVFGYNSETLYLINSYLPTAFSSVGIEPKLFDILGNIGDLTALVLLYDAAESVTQAGEEYKIAKEKGVENIYKIREKYIEYAIKSIELLEGFLNVLSYFDNSIEAPSPDIDSVLEKFGKLTKYIDLEKYYRRLADVESIINNSMCVNDVLGRLGITQFAEVEDRHFSEDAIYAAMKKGPTAKEIAEVIPHIISETKKSEQELTENTASALWYYYGWRLQYEYEIFVDWIYHDEPGSFQSYLKNQSSQSSQLKEGTEIDPFDFLEITYNGYSPYASLVLTNTSTDDYLKDIDFVADKFSNLEEGETFTVTVFLGQESYLSEKGYIFSLTEKEYTAIEVPQPKEIDLFDYLDFNFSSLNGNIELSYAMIKGILKDKFLCSVQFQADKTKNLTAGETIKFTVSYPDKPERYGYKVISDEMTITVPRLGDYITITDLNAVSDNIRTQIIDAMKGEISKVLNEDRDLGKLYLRYCVPVVHKSDYYRMDDFISFDNVTPTHIYRCLDTGGLNPNKCNRVGIVYTVDLVGHPMEEANCTAYSYAYIDDVILNPDGTLEKGWEDKIMVGTSAAISYDLMYKLWFSGTKTMVVEEIK